jgi:hypothetical protein
MFEKILVSKERYIIILNFQYRRGTGGGEKETEEWYFKNIFF